MAGGSAIKAGEAYYELSLKGGALTKGLQRMQAKMKAFAASAKSIGAKMAGMGAAIRAPFAAAEGIFAEMGTQMADAAEKTGATVESLSQLKYAAEQSNVGFDELQNGLRKMQKGIGEAEQGNGEAVKSFRKLGISVSELKSLSPDKQFELIADKISQVSDPAERAAISMEVFGKSGDELLPLLMNGAKGIDGLMKKADELGFTMSAADAESAKGLTQSLKTLWQTVQVAAFNVGASLAPALKELIDHVRVYLKAGSDWIKQNRGVVIAVAQIGTVLAAAGIAIYGIGEAASIVGTAFGFLSTAVGILTSPFVLLPALIGGAVYVFARFTAAGQAMAHSVENFIAPMLQTFERTFGGIKNAIASGNLGLAVSIAFKGMQVAMLQTMGQIADSVGGAFGDFIGGLGADLAKGDLSGAWNTMLGGLSLAWATFSQSVVNVASGVVRAIIGLWEDLSGRIGDFLQKQIEEHGLLAKIIDPDGKGAKNPAMEANIARLKANLDPNASRRAAMAMLPEDEQKRIMAGMSAAERAHLDDKNGDKFQQRGTDSAAAKASDIIAAQAKQLNKALDAVQRQAEANTKRAVDGISQHGRAAAHDGLIAAQVDLTTLLAQARDLKTNADAAAAEAAKHAQDGHDALADTAKSMVAGTFNAAAAGRSLGVSSGIEKRLDMNISQLKNLNNKIDKVAQQIGFAGMAFAR
jgi:hypothetical protein